MSAKATVLIVDDEIGPRESLKMALKPTYHIEEADGGLQAMQILHKRKVDLVTLDLKMPGMDGIAVLKSIKEYNPRIEVLVITGHGTRKSAVELVQLGACGYQTKPFNVQQIVSEVSRAIENKKRHDRSIGMLSDTDDAGHSYHH